MDFNIEDFKGEVRRIQAKGRFISPLHYSIYVKIRGTALQALKDGHYSKAYHYFDYAVRYADLNKMGVLSDDLLEEGLYAIALKMLGQNADVSIKLVQFNKQFKATSKKPKIGFAISHAEDSGGITEICLRFIEAFKKKYDLCYFLSDAFWSSEKSHKFKQMKAEIPGHLTSYVGSEQRLDKIPFKTLELFEQILKERVDILYAHTYPYDIIWGSVLALVKNQTNIKVVYYNHQDSVFNLGTTYADVIIENRPESLHLTNLYRNKKNVVLIPLQGAKTPKKLTAQKATELRKKLKIAASDYVSISGTHGYKIFVDQELEYFHFLKKILKETPNLRHILLINMYDEQKQCLEKIFADEPTARKRLHVIAPNAAYMDYFNLANFYIVPFPFTGALTLVDAMSMGLPLIYKNDPKVPISSVATYLYDDYECVGETQQDLVALVHGLIKSPTKLAKIRSKILKQYETVHGFESVNKKYQTLFDTLIKDGAIKKFDTVKKKYDMKYRYLFEYYNHLLDYMGMSNFNIAMSGKVYESSRDDLVPEVDNLRAHVGELQANVCYLTTLLRQK